VTVERTLADRVESTNFFQFIAKEGQSNRLLEDRREKIDQVAAHRIAAAVLDQGDALITEGRQILQQVMPGNLLARFKLQRQALQNTARQDFLLQRPDRGNDGLAATGSESRKG
jgi:hypothetical protein